jgi:hypothetical protein
MGDIRTLITTKRTVNLHLLIYNTLIMNVYLRYSYRKHEIGYLIRLTDSFSWEDLPTRDPVTGYLTNAGYIRFIPSLTKYITALAFAFHGTQSIARIVLNHDMVFTTWYPFDVSASPAYEIANFTQVTLNHISLFKINPLRILYRNKCYVDKIQKVYKNTLNYLAYRQKGKFHVLPFCPHWCLYSLIFWGIEKSCLKPKINRTQLIPTHLKLKQDLSTHSAARNADRIS